MKIKKSIKQHRACSHVEVVIIEREEYGGRYNIKKNSAYKISENPDFYDTQIFCVKCEEEVGANLD